MKALLEKKSCSTCASVFDPLSARMADDIGFDIGILGGSVVSLTTLGAPDIYLLTLSELVDQAKRVCTASNLPIIVDGDNGYGNALNVRRMMEELEYAGAAAVTIEDTVLPRNYDDPELTLVSIEENKTKLKMALQARTDPNFSILARTHAMNSQSLDELVTRIKAYSSVGVDGICVFGLSEKEKLMLIAEVTDLPIMLITYGDVDLGTPETLAKQNVRIHMKGHHAYEASVKATYQSLMALYSNDRDYQVDESAKDLIAHYSQAQKYTDLTSTVAG